MTVHAFTSFTYSYLDRARVLARSVRELHPDWVIWAVLTDTAPEGFDHDWSKEDFHRILRVEDLIGETTEQWLFEHDIVEACTAVKGPAAVRILAESGCRKLIYFDPDIALFNPMDDVLELLDRYDIVLTPHQLDPDVRVDRGAILDNEIGSLLHGAYNLGFVAVANTDEGRRFAAWWDDRLRDWCHDRKDMGLFVDQKWCDLVPCFFDGVKILRDPGYNVASWNLSQRKVSFDGEGTALVNGRPLRFYHFTKLGAIGDTMTQRYARDNHEVYEIWLWYRFAVAAAQDDRIPLGYWYYGTFDNGVKIPTGARRLYRSRLDLRRAFPAPRRVENGFYGWLESETDMLTQSEDTES